MRSYELTQFTLQAVHPAGLLMLLLKYKLLYIQQDF